MAMVLCRESVSERERRVRQVSRTGNLLIRRCGWGWGWCWCWCSGCGCGCGCGCGWGWGCGLKNRKNLKLGTFFLNVLHPSNLCPDSTKPCIDILITPVDLLNVMNGGCTFCGKCRDQQRNSRPNIGRGHRGSF